MLKYDEAITTIDQYQFNVQTQVVDTFASLDHILADDITSQINVPNFRKSAMDGYALNSADDLSQEFSVVDTIYAGDQHNPIVQSGECVRIMTGAQVPDGLDQVIVQELATKTDNLIKFAIPPTKLNANICEIGEDIKQDQFLFRQGERITATKISSMLSCGIFTVKIFKKPKILLITTGDEVVNTPSPLEHGQIYNSNLAYLKSRLLELGYVCDNKHLTDDIRNLQTVFSGEYDLIITTGAISVGERDIVRQFIEQNNVNIIFDRVNIMPGGPCVFWQYQNIPIISLAGSPFANFVTFELFARRIIAKLSQDSSLIAQKKQLVLDDCYSKKIKKMRFLKAQITGQHVTIPANNHLASSMHEMTLCNCLIKLERKEHNLTNGDIVSVIDLRRNHE